MAQTSCDWTFAILFDGNSYSLRGTLAPCTHQNTPFVSLCTEASPNRSSKSTQERNPPLSTDSLQFQELCPSQALNPTMMCDNMQHLQGQIVMKVHRRSQILLQDEAYLQVAKEAKLFRNKEKKSPSLSSFSSCSTTHSMNVFLQ